MQRHAIKPSMANRLHIDSGRSPYDKHSNSTHDISGMQNGALRTGCELPRPDELVRFSPELAGSANGRKITTYAGAAYDQQREINKSEQPATRLFPVHVGVAQNIHEL